MDNARTTTYYYMADTETFEEVRNSQPSQPATMRSFWKEYPGWALALYTLPFVITWIATSRWRLPLPVALLSTLSTILVLSIGLAKDLPAGVNPVVTITPLLVFGAYYVFQRKW